MSHQEQCDHPPVMWSWSWDEEKQKRIADCDKCRLNLFTMRAARDGKAIVCINSDLTIQAKAAIRKIMVNCFGNELKIV